MKKYCCDSFRFYCEIDKNMGLNFRIIKLSQDFVDRGYFGNNKYRYIITDGYQNFNTSVKKLVIEFCPFCGKELKKNYCSDEFVNESSHEI